MLDPSIKNESKSKGENMIKFTTTLDSQSAFYKNCVRQRRKEAKICQDCPFREAIEKAEIHTKKK